MKLPFLLTSVLAHTSPHLHILPYNHWSRQYALSGAVHLQNTQIFILFYYFVLYLATASWNRFGLSFF